VTYGQSRKNYKLRDKAERKTRPFDPTFNMKGDVHISVTFIYENGQLVPMKAEKVFGILPYRSSEDGEFKIKYYNSEGKVLGTIYQKDPTLYRSCEEGTGPAIQEISAGAQVTILLPFRRDIATIAFKTNIRDHEFTSQNIQAYVGRLE
jgi:hypothetical protein